MNSISDSREDIVKKKREVSTLELAGFWRRFVAVLIDLFALAAISSVILLIFAPYQWFGFGGFWGTGDVFEEPVWRALPYLIGGNLLSLIVNIAYFVGFWLWRGQTPGKILMNIKLIRADASNVSVSVALLRYLGYIVSGAVVFIGFIWIAFDSQKQGFHDKMAETYVVKIPESTITAPSPKMSLGG
ncbi:MAG: RDD family protein [Dehalococcoidia bacterium]|nr:MAG: RDD family protein [Dehalococcoidia bacterium]